MTGILPMTRSDTHPALRTAGMGISNTHRRISLTWLPSNKENPLVRKNRRRNRRKRNRNRRRNLASDQRSFHSLVEDFGSRIHEPLPNLDEIYEEGEPNVHYDGDEVSRTTSLPSTADEAPESPPDVNWILQEHGRRYSSTHGSVNDDGDNDEQEPQPFPNREMRYNDFINKVQSQRQDFNKALNPSSQFGSGTRRSSFISVASRGAIPNVFQEDLNKDTLVELAHEEVTFESEAKILASYSLPLMFTFLLEDIFPLVCSITVGHLGKNELAAVSLASMTSNITLGFFSGIATSLDTLCPQAYGAGRYHSVGVNLQRCMAFSMVVYIPFALFWYYSEHILYYVVPEKELVKLTAQFLRVLIFGAPPYICFENMKRYLQAQGIFDAGIYILTICAPINILMCYTLVWNKYIGMGFIGSAVSVVINFWLMFILLLLYIVFVNGDKCWGGFSRKAFTHWKDLSSLAFSGVVMLVAEELSYELLTLFSAYFGVEYLATQSAVSSVAALMYMIPFAIGISTSTRIANFIGAVRIDHAHLASKVGLSASFVAGFANCCILFFGRHIIARIFSKDQSVRDLISSILPVVALVENFDALNAIAGACLRGQGMQSIGSVANFVGYYFFGIPLAMSLSWFLDWKLYGLWIGIGCAMLGIGVVEAYFVLFPDWDVILHRSAMMKANDEESEDEGYISSSSSSSSSSESDEEDNLAQVTEPIVEPSEQTRLLSTTVN